MKAMRAKCVPNGPFEDVAYNGSVRNINKTVIWELNPKGGLEKTGTTHVYKTGTRVARGNVKVPQSQFAPDQKGTVKSVRIQCDSKEGSWVGRGHTYYTPYLTILLDSGDEIEAMPLEWYPEEFDFFEIRKSQTIESIKHDFQRWISSGAIYEGDREAAIRAIIRNYHDGCHSFSVFSGEDEIKSLVREFDG